MPKIRIQKKRHSIIPFLLCLLFVTSAWAIVVMRGRGFTVEPAGWDNSLTLTIDSSKVDADITDFPLLVYLSTSSGIGNTNLAAVFTELGANSNRISVQLADATELYVEVEKWDTATTQAWLWVKVPTVSNAADMALTLYYDNDQDPNTNYVGGVGSSAGTNVWNTDYKLVWHMHEGGTNTRYDSTGYDNDGTPLNYNGDEAITAKIDGGDTFDGVDDMIRCATVSDFASATSGSFSAWINISEPTGDYTFFSMSRGADGTLSRIVIFRQDSGQRINGYLFEDDVRPWGFSGAENAALYFSNTYAHVTITHNGTEASTYVNGTNYPHASWPQDVDRKPWFKAIFTDASSPADSINLAGIYNNGAAEGVFPGPCDDYRITTEPRSAAWIKVDYHSGNDSLITYTVNP